DGIDAIYGGKEIRGNFGMHQDSQAVAAIVRQTGPEHWLTDILTTTGRGLAHEGLNYALYNLIYRDGYPFETSPGYNGLWVSHLTKVAELLKPGGIDLFKNPKLHALDLGETRL